MKFFVILPAVLLAGCAWLESADVAARQKLVLPDAQIQQLTGEALSLRLKSEQVRTEMASQADRHVRMKQYRELRDLEDARLPLERLLEDAGQPLPSAVTAPAGT